MKKSKGLTLIEVIIAIFVLSIGFISVLQLYPLGIKTSRTSYHQSVASAIAQGKIEEIFSKNYDEIVDIPPQKVNTNPNSPFYLYTWQANVSFVDPSNNLQEIQTDKGIKRIEIVISWNEANKQKRYIINTLYTKR